jgi:hypothetical protein
MRQTAKIAAEAFLLRRLQGVVYGGGGTAGMLQDDEKFRFKKGENFLPR